MADEKIMNEEVMSDEELSEVAGGADWEIQDDANKLRALQVRYGINLLPTGRKVSTREVNDAFVELGNLISKYGHCDFHLGCNFKGGTDSNRYYINNHKKNHEELWDAIYRQARKFD